MTTKIEAEFELPSKENFWLIELLDVNEKRFIGKRGKLLKKYTDSSCFNYDDSYMRLKHDLHSGKFRIASIDFKEDEANFTFKKIRQFTVSPEEISYTIDFGFGNEIKAETIEKLKNKIEERIEGCERHIENTKKSKSALENLLKEFIVC